MRRQKFNGEEQFSKSYNETWLDRAGSYLLIGIVIMIIVAIVKGIEWIMR